jgi:hypothetical protein
MQQRQRKASSAFRKMQSGSRPDALRANGTNDLFPARFQRDVYWPFGVAQCWRDRSIQGGFFQSRVA